MEDMFVNSFIKCVLDKILRCLKNGKNNDMYGLIPNLTNIY